MNYLRKTLASARHVLTPFRHPDGSRYQSRHGVVTRRIEVWVSLVVAGTVSCSWSRFDDILNSAPVQILKTPADVTSFGRSLAVLRNSSSTWAFATADGGYAVYEFGKQDLNSVEATRDGTCMPSDGCWMGASVATVVLQIDSKEVPCVAHGIRTSKTEAASVALYCKGGSSPRLYLPDPAPAEITKLSENSAPPRIQFASGPRLTPDVLVVASPGSGAVWFYASSGLEPISLARPADTDESFGTAVAVAGQGTTRYFAMGAPDGATLHVVRVDGSTPANLGTCIIGPKRFASALAAGHFASPDSTDLAVASESEVVVLTELDSLPFSSDPAAPCVPLANVDGVRSLGCQALNGGSACGTLLSGVALAATDLDGDEREELLIGAPSASPGGNDAAGKIIVTSFAKTKPTVVEELSHSSAESGDRFGSSIVGVPLSRPDVILAGAPGGNKIAALFCTKLLPSGKGGVRCN